MRLMLLLISSICYGQATVPIPDLQLTARGQTALIRWLARQGTSVRATLTSGLSGVATTLTVDVANWQPPINTLIGVDSEIMLVTAKTGSSLTVTRARLGSTAAPHAAGAVVIELRYQTAAEALKAIVIDYLRAQLRQDDTINAAIKTAEQDRETALAGDIR